MPEIPLSIILLGVGTALTALGCFMLQPKGSLVTKGLSILPLLGGVYLLIAPQFNLLPSLLNAKIPDRITLFVYLAIWLVWGVGMIRHRTVAGVILGILVLLIGGGAGFVMFGNPDLSAPGQIFWKVFDGVMNIIEQITGLAGKLVGKP